MKKIFLICAIILLATFINFAKADDIFYTVVISSGKNVQAAQKLADDMIKKGFEANVMTVTLNTGNTNRVCIGKSSTKEGAEEIQKKLAKAGYSSSWIAVINGTNEQKAVVKKLPEKKPADEIETYTVDVVKVTPVTEKSKEKSYDIYVDKSVPVAEKKVVKATKKDNTAIPAPPDVDKLPLAVPKEFSGNKSESTIVRAKTDEKTSIVKTSEVSIGKDEVFSTDTILIITGKGSGITNSTKYKPNDNVIYPGVTTIETDTLNRNVVIVTSDVILAADDDVIIPRSAAILPTEPDDDFISDDRLLIRNEPFLFKTNSTDTLEILKAAPDAQVIQSQPINSKEGDVVIHTVNVGTAQPENRSITTDHLSVSTISPAKSEISVKPVETEINPKMESIIPGTNLSYNQFYTEIKKIFYALEKYSLASGTLLNEYIDPTYGTYLRFRNNNNVAFEKMIKPKDIYKNPQVKSNVLMFFQDMVKVRRQPAVIEPLPQYDCSLKHIPGLNIYLSSLEKGSKFSDETVKYLKTSGATLTNEEIGTILEANKTINAAFSIGSSELIKTVYFAVEGDKIYIRYIDMYDNCDKK